MSSGRISFHKDDIHRNTMNYLSKHKDSFRDDKSNILDISKDTQASGELLNNILSFNSQVGRGILFCLQNQMNMAQAFMDLVQHFEGEKGPVEYLSVDSALQANLKPGRTSEVSSQDTSSFQNPPKKDKVLSNISSRVERMINDLFSALSPFQPSKSESSSSLQKSHTVTSPPASSVRNWTQDLKRASVPLVIDSLTAKKADISSINLGDRRASTDSAHHFLNGLKIPATTSNATAQLIDTKSVKQFLKKKQASVNKNNVSKASVKLSPKPREEQKDKSKSRISFIHDESKISNSSQPLREISLSREANTSKLRDAQRERFAPERQQKQTDVIPRKDLVEESITTDQNADKTQTLNSSASLAMPSTETARMARVPELDGNALIMSLNNLRLPPMQEKRIVKELMKEQAEGLGSQIFKVCGRMTEKVNLIDARWWRSWKEYVNFDSENDSNNMVIGIYPRPGRITNRGLLKYDVIEDFGALTGDLELREHLLEHHDYQVVSKRIYDMLAKWYGCDFEITRPLRLDPFKSNKLIVDLYPRGLVITEARGKGLKKNLSPQSNAGNGKVLSNIINTNLQNFQGKMK